VRCPREPVDAQLHQGLPPREVDVLYVTSLTVTVVVRTVRLSEPGTPPAPVAPSGPDDS
jgi:hypothetical protein